ncbi:MAG: alpha-L-fucosidase [Verrucomicrobiae bacterium]|nr:alpha-L-fucosidase [Verrucomicrobiae bacterium]
MLLFILALTLNVYAADNPLPAPPENTPIKATNDPAAAKRLAWWTDARFGMFIHWDMSSMAGTEISWSRKGTKPLDITHDPAGYVEDPAYDHLYEKFNPTNFNARQWVKLAQDAGMKYIVFTAKHHGGFCMWDTQLTDYSIMHTPFHRDVVKELADACHAAGMRFGIYYSPRDWHQPDYGIGDNRKYVDYMNGQLRELLTRYGKIDILWFDSYGRGDLVDFWRIGETFDLIKSLQPDIVINNRLAILGGYNKQPAPYRGDFDTPEQKIGKFQNDRPWESCLSLVTAKGGGWSYRPDGKVKTFAQCIQALVNCAGGDGNLLLDVGPNSLGEIPAEQTERLRQIGAWLKVNGPAIYGTRGCQFPLGLAWGSSTMRITPDDATLYLHVFKWPTDGKLVVPDLMNPVTKAYVLKPNRLGQHQTLKVASVAYSSTNEPSVTLAVPKTAPDPVSTTVVLKMKMPPSIYLGPTFTD